MTSVNELLKDLNPAQLQAVQHPPQIPLQILAGPGSGKTKVLTMRIAHLITNCYLPPWSICAVTFTNKAANEMRERLVKLIGKDNTAQIKMGTFHALCAKFLRRYAKYVGIEGNFTVCDADESKKIIAKLLKQYVEFLKENNISLKEGSVLSMISKLKAKGLTADDALKKAAEYNRFTDQERNMRHFAEGTKPDLLEGKLGHVIASIYKEYEKLLRGSNSLDFDDLLLFGVKLFSQQKQASTWCQHVLVDEYQDTNTTQYELMRFIAQTCRCVTIVGDPDQSIYGWRSAEIENLANMKRDFPTTQQIYLEQNYRSTASILAASMAFISQDKNRIQKTLNTSHAKGPTPVLRAFPMEQVEAGFIAAEIKRLVAFSGGMLNWSDFVVLLRFNALSRTIESALQKEGIPNRVLAGHKFFERLEIKDVLAYLQLVDNPAFVPAFTRVVNVPSRSVGEKTVAELLHRAEQLKISPLTVVERIVDGKIPDIKPPVKKKLGHFVGVIRDMRKFANEGMSPSKLIQSFLELINYGEHLRKTQPDYESRWDNVQELINFATEVENGMPSAVEKKMRDAEDAAHEELWGDNLGEWDADQVEDRNPAEGQATGDTPLRLFLQASMLSTDTETPEDEKSKEKVTISTCHAAKGLEWAVVMIPAVVNGVFPSSRAEDVEEELRLLYVACTRAQGLLYLTHTTTRMVSGESMPQSVSQFVAAVRSDSKTRGTLSEELPVLTPQDRATLSKVLNSRPLPDDAEVARRVADYERTGRHPIWGHNAPFRDLSGVRVNGYGVPQRYPGAPVPEQHPRFPGNGRVLQAQQRQKPPRYPNQPRQQKPPQTIKQEPLQAIKQEPLQAVKQEPIDIIEIDDDDDDVPEPAIFVASSLVHFNDAHRAGIVRSTQQTSSSASASASVAQKPPFIGRNVNALASSSGRVVNAATTRGLPTGNNLRSWIVQPGAHRGTSTDDSPSKGKGKAKATEPAAGQSPIKLEPGHVKLEPPLTALPSVVHPKGKKSSSAVKMEPTSTPSMPPPYPRAGQPVFPPVKTEPHTADDWGRRSAAAMVHPRGIVKAEENSSAYVSGPLIPKCSPRSSPAHGRPSSSGPSIPSSSRSSSNNSSPATPSADASANSTAVKRRLGMGRATGGYANKKFKPMLPGGS
ncbi:UvrD-helicase-domain-containing protein [Polyporus arcularius HHB13444]|uniref:DNA 3'-5' helicase n=1 Tax=Polyporus arcularius HHB13444 TaxID=1314778 RepID=A0A5C3NV64_9APHY|nr:UvrD-helicase-domain-containing protein [Polyporus arcularius HHB13444]